MTLNLQEELPKPHSTCPYCLTIVTEPNLENNGKPEKEQIESVVNREKPSKNKEKSIACHYHLGYLGEREKKEQFPDECMVCTQIVECMLKKMP